MSQITFFSGPGIQSPNIKLFILHCVINFLLGEIMTCNNCANCPNREMCEKRKQEELEEKKDFVDQDGRINLEIATDYKIKVQTE